MKEKLLSVVIPAYNAENYISTCLEALISQTYSALEIIVVDDGSTDSTLDISKEYAKSDERIKVYTYPHSGVSAARNKGIEIATGDYIMFCDADDYPEPDLANSYIRAYKEWKHSSISFVACGMYFDNVFSKNISNKKHLLEVDYGYVEGESYILSRSVAATLLWLKIFNFVTNKCYGLNVIKEKNIRFDEAVNIGEDLNFNLDFLEATSGNIGLINRPLYHYVKHSDESLSISYHVNDIEDTKRIYKRFIEWESSLPEATPDNILVIKAIFINDWVSRLTAFYTKKKNDNEIGDLQVKIRLEKEIKSHEFQTMLKEIYQGGKISTIRYACLRTGVFHIFYFFRSVYRFFKG